MELKEFQEEMAASFKDFDEESGPLFLMSVAASEFGELANAVRRGKEKDIEEEIADVVFAMVSLANIYGIDLSDALEKKYSKRAIGDITKGWSEPALKGRVEGLRRKG